MKRGAQAWAIVASVGLAACGAREPETTTPEAQRTAGGTMTTEGQADPWVQQDPLGQQGPQQDRLAQQDQYDQQSPPGQDPWIQQEDPLAQQDPWVQQEDPLAQQDPWVQQEDPLAQGEPSAPPEPIGAEAEQEGPLQARIEQALRAAPSVDESGIRVSVEGGEVELAGLVDSPTEVLIARDVAQAVPGVASVSIDELRVRQRP